MAESTCDGITPSSEASVMGDGRAKSGAAQEGICQERKQSSGLSLGRNLAKLGKT